jgi:hypothetical protein
MAFKIPQQIIDKADRKFVNQYDNSLMCSLRTLVRFIEDEINNVPQKPVQKLENIEQQFIEAKIKQMENEEFNFLDSIGY